MIKTGRKIDKNRKKLCKIHLQIIKTRSKHLKFRNQKCQKSQNKPEFSQIFQVFKSGKKSKTNKGEVKNKQELKKFSSK